MTIIGLDKFLSLERYKNRNIGILTNQASVNFEKIHNIKLLLRHGYKIKKIFVPEHGLWGNYGGGEKVKNGIDPIYNLPVISLYNEKNEFSIEDFQDIDIFIYDIQDITARFYTYIATLKGIMEFFHKHSIDIQLIILDRPSFLGKTIQGTLPEHLNFLSPEYIPIRYGMTPGEFALFVKEKNQLDIKLEIITLENYDKSLLFKDLPLPFVSPSSAIKNFDIAFFYSGSCLLEGTTLSEGRGTDLPFLIFGSPNFEAFDINFQGIQYEIVEFTPKYNKYKDKLCKGIKINAIDYNKAHPFRDIVLFLMDYYYYIGFDFILPHFDRLTGGEFIRNMIMKRNKKAFLEYLKESEQQFYKEQINLY